MQLFWYELGIQFFHVATLFSQYHILNLNVEIVKVCNIRFSIDFSCTVELRLNRWPHELHILSIHETVTEHMTMWSGIKDKPLYKEGSNPDLQLLTVW